MPWRPLPSPSACPGVSARPHPVGLAAALHPSGRPHTGLRPDQTQGPPLYCPHPADRGPVSSSVTLLEAAVASYSSSARAVRQGPVPRGRPRGWGGRAGHTEGQAAGERGQDRAARRGRPPPGGTHSPGPCCTVSGFVASPLCTFLDVLQHSHPSFVTGRAVCWETLCGVNADPHGGSGGGGSRCVGL